jgi:hypothetical protein
MLGLHDRHVILRALSGLQADHCGVRTDSRANPSNSNRRPTRLAISEPSVDVMDDSGPGRNPATPCDAEAMVLLTLAKSAR